MGPARPGLVRNTVGSLAVLGVVAFFAIGLPSFDHFFPPDRALPAAAYVVGGDVSVVPPLGARLDVTRTRPGADRGTALLQWGDVRIAVVVLPYRGDLNGAAQRLRDKITRTGGTDVTSADQPARTNAGVAGVRGDYRSSDRTGEYAVFVDSHRSVEVTLSGQGPDIQERQPALDATLTSIVFRSGR